MNSCQNQFDIVISNIESNDCPKYGRDCQGKKLDYQGDITTPFSWRLCAKMCDELLLCHFWAYDVYKKDCDLYTHCNEVDAEHGIMMGYIKSCPGSKLLLD